jgi:hypothetical protein
MGNNSKACKNIKRLEIRFSIIIKEVTLHFLWSGSGNTASCTICYNLRLFPEFSYQTCLIIIFLCVEAVLL